MSLTQNPPLTGSVPQPSMPSMRRDLFAAYVAAAARIGAWALVSALVYRLAGAGHFATLALIRGTIGILNYTSVGLSPALIRLLAEAGEHSRDFIVNSPRGPVNTPPRVDDDRATSVSPERAIYSTGTIVAGVSMLAGFVLTGLYATRFSRLHMVPSALLRQTPGAVVLIGMGTLLRLGSDASGALLQTRGRIALDNYLLAAADIAWAVSTAALFKMPGLLTASTTYAASGLFLLLARTMAVARVVPSCWPPVVVGVNRQVLTRLLSFGSMVLVAQLADYLYAPTDYILINHFFGPMEVAAYAPGVQIDLGLLMLVTGMAGVLLPKSALAHTAGDMSSVRRYFVRGTVASTVVLALAALVVWLAYPLIFHLWFGNRPPDTRRILDLVLICTIVGGSSAVGRSVLLAMGRIKAFSLAALIAGAVNVISSYCFVRYAGFGLRGILYGTVVAVVGRCGVWMPWYVMRTLRDEASHG